MAAMREEQDRIAQAETQAAVLELTGGGESQETLVMGQGTPVYEVPDPESKQRSRPKLRRSSVPPVKATQKGESTDGVTGEKPSAVKARARPKNQVNPKEVKDTKAGEVEDTEVVTKKASDKDKEVAKVKDTKNVEPKKRAKKTEKPATSKESKEADINDAGTAHEVGLGNYKD